MRFLLLRILFADIHLTESCLCVCPSQPAAKCVPAALGLVLITARLVPAGTRTQRAPAQVRCRISTWVKGVRPLLGTSFIEEF